MKGETRKLVAGECEHETSDLLKIAVKNYEDVLLDLHDMKTVIRSSEKFSESEARRVVSMVSKTIQHIYDERKRLNDLYEKRQRADGDGGIDFDEVRAQIRSRLDRIRSSGSRKVLPG